MKNTWERHVKRVRLTNITGTSPEKSAHDQVVSSKYSSYLPSVYTGLANRVDRYRQYDQMDQDPEISNGLDIIADFCTQNLDDLMSSFEIRYKDHMGATEIQIINDRRVHWSKLNDFTTRIFEMFRNTLKYGDQFFIRDPETYEWHWVDPYNVEKIILNESLGKEPIIYYIKGVALNLKDKVASNNLVNAAITAYPGSMPNSLGNGQQYGGGSGGATGDMFRGGNTETIAVDAEHVIHISLSSGMDQYAPFGVSILENVFKTYKQKELLEDSIIIYRVQRAPERRVFKIDTGELPPNIAMQHVERVKNSIHQRRIPNAKGGSTSLMDAAYNPMCLDMETRIPLLDGRVLTIRELANEYQAGKENWVYSCHPVTGDIVPGNITWAGVTRVGAKVVKINLDNGESIICTPDHKIPVLGYGFKEAKDLTTDDSLISFSSDGTTVYDHSVGEYVYTGELVGNYFKEISKHQEFTYLLENHGSEKNVVHHKDLNKNNNDPRNIQWMNVVDCAHYMADSSYTVEKTKKHGITAAIVSIEYLDDTMDVGTITVDGQERWHNFHTFATEAGVFVKNSILEDYFFPQSADGRGSSVETLPGGENLGQIDDLKWFNNKLIRGLKIPSSYLPFGPDDSNALFNDGKMGQALIQELRFNNYCQRLQNTIVKQFDYEFKKFIVNSGNNIDCSSFNLVFRPPTNFASYRKAELESSLINAYSSLHEIPFIAKQTVLKKMGWTEEEIAENERLYLQENPNKKKQSSAGASISGATGLGGGMDDAGLQSVGVPNPDDPDTSSDSLDLGGDNTGTDQLGTGESFT